jgi:hypothetical protein
MNRQKKTGFFDKLIFQALFFTQKIAIFAPDYKSKN